MKLFYLNVLRLIDQCNNELINDLLRKRSYMSSEEVLTMLSLSILHWFWSAIANTRTIIFIEFDFTVKDTTFIGAKVTNGLFN